MTENELKSMTVIELRKLAKANDVVLGAGIDKAGIVEKIWQKLSSEDSSSPVSAPADETAASLTDEASQSSAPSAPEEEAASPAAPEEAAPAAPRFQAAWHNTEAPRFAGRSSYQPQPASYGSRSSWQGTAPAGRPANHEQPRVSTARPGTGAPRFGPAMTTTPAFGPGAANAAPPARTESHPVSPLPDRRVGFSGDASAVPARPIAAFGPSISASPALPVTPSSYVPPTPSVDPLLPEQDSSSNQTLEELLASGDYVEGSGILELHPDGYGFLRASNFMPSSRDVYVSMAQIRRFGLRTGDLVEGKIRPQQEGDKYAAMLYITSVNGMTEEELPNRPSFDELTPIYPNRRISLESKDGKSFPDMRLVDLIAPIGFGQRGLVLCPPETGKMELMIHFAQVVCNNYPDIEALMLLIDVNPEDVTMVRETVPCPVLASTFDQTPDTHLRLSEIVLERAMRLVEQKKDVVLFVDSLTRLAKIYTTAATQQGRNVPGMVNPASLFRAKRLFGAARCCKEGGSLTVLAAMDVMTGSKVDDSVVEEFKGTANMELTLDLSVARANIKPPLNLNHSYTKNADILLDARQKEGLQLIRSMLGSTSSAVAIPQLVSMMEKTDDNATLLLKMKDWFALMNR